MVNYILVLYFLVPAAPNQPVHVVRSCVEVASPSAGKAFLAGVQPREGEKYIVSGTVESVAVSAGLPDCADQF